jgi:hypothetical protein
MSNEIHESSMDGTTNASAAPTPPASVVDCGNDPSNEFEAANPDELGECRRLCRRPLFRAVQEDFLSLLSPCLWAGLARLRRVSFDSLAKGLMNVLWPPLIYSLAYSVAHSPWVSARAVPPASSTLSTMPEPRRAAIPYALSPWALYHLYYSCKPIFALAAQVVAFRTVFRSRLLDEAVVELGRRIRQNRARRCPLYDLYLPPPPPLPSPALPASSDRETWVLFLPGAGVSPVAYSRPAAMLSDAGMCVVVVNTEGTLRLSSHHVGYTTERCRSIQLLALSQKPFSLSQRQARAAGVRWVGVGHSMGCFTLSHLDWKELQLEKVAFWGISPLFVQDLADLSSLPLPSSSPGAPPPLLIVQGSDDALNRIAASTNPDLERQFYAKLPSMSENASASVLDAATSATPLAHVAMVEGGTHRGFASYESRLLAEPQGDGQRARQQRRAVDLTVEFILRKDGQVAG